MENLVGEIKDKFYVAGKETRNKITSVPPSLLDESPSIDLIFRGDLQCHLQHLLWFYVLSHLYGETENRQCIA